jgi:ATP-dependent protease ClpP protease subunit
MLKNKYNIDTGPINLHIQSNGGSLFHSIYIVDLIQNLETPVYTYIDGFAASAATLISVSGKKRYMSKNSLMLIHQLSGGVNGKFFEIKDESENLDGLMNFIIKTYLENSKMEEDNLREILKRDIWLNASYCLKNGLVDGIL